MERMTRWLRIMVYILLAFFPVSALTNNDAPVTLKLIFDKYSTPHANFLINGSPVYAMIDTGSSMGFHLEASQLARIKGLKKQRTYRSTDSAGKIQDNIAYLADSLNVNGIILKDVTVTPFKQWGMMISGESPPPGGPVAGLGAFKDQLIMLDYAASTLTILADVNYQTLIGQGFKELPFRLSSSGMVFDVEQSGHHYHLILDTGATVSMVWHERLKTRQSVSCQLVDPEMDNAGCEAAMLTIKSTDGQPAQFAAVIVAGDFKHMGDIDGLMGNNFLRNKKVLLDLKNNKAFFADDHREK